MNGNDKIYPICRVYLLGDDGKSDTGSIERVNQTRNRWRRGESQADGGTRVRSAYLFNAQKAECSRGRSTYSHYIGLVRFYRGIVVLPYNTGGLSRREKHDMCTLYATTIRVSFTETRRQREREREMTMASKC